jgi:hypothetical protein
MKSSHVFRIGHYGVRYRRIIDGWQIWLMGNAALTIGTYLFLADNGRVSKITIHEDGGVTEIELDD